MSSDLKTRYQLQPCFQVYLLSKLPIYFCCDATEQICCLQIFEGIGSSYGHILSAICVKQHDQYLQM